MSTLYVVFAKVCLISIYFILENNFLTMIVFLKWKERIMKKNSSVNNKIDEYEIIKLFDRRYLILLLSLFLIEENNYLRKYINAFFKK